MVCKNKWLERAKEMEKLTQLAPESVDGAPRCVKCNRPLLKSGQCVMGHAQTASQKQQDYPEELDGILCVVGDLAETGRLAAPVAAAVQRARQFQDLTASPDETSFQLGVDHVRELLRQVEESAEGADLADDPRVRAARALVQLNPRPTIAELDQALRNGQVRGIDIQAELHEGAEEPLVLVWVDHPAEPTSPAENPVARAQPAPGAVSRRFRKAAMDAWAQSDFRRAFDSFNRIALYRALRGKDPEQRLQVAEDMLSFAKNRGEQAASHWVALAKAVDALRQEQTAPADQPPAAGKVQLGVVFLKSAPGDAWHDAAAYPGFGELTTLLREGRAGRVSFTRTEDGKRCRGSWIAADDRGGWEVRDSLPALVAAVSRDMQPVSAAEGAAAIKRAAALNPYIQEHADSISPGVVTQWLHHYDDTGHQATVEADDAAHCPHCEWQADDMYWSGPPRK